MRFNGWICSLLFVLVGFQAAAQSAESCISRSEMQEISNHFTQFKNLAEKGDYCFDDSQTSHLLAGIMFMRKTQFAASMPNSIDELFSGRFSTDWYQYFIGRIDEFSVQSDCPKGVGAYVYFFGKTMYVCPMLLSKNFTALDRASVFMHEARHIDGYPHMTCKSGARQGMNGACDTRISDGGSYAVTVETYAQLSAYAGELHPALRAYARSSAVVYADEAFDTPARVTRTQQFLVMTKDQEFHTLKTAGRLEFKTLGRAPSLGHIVMRGQHMILYPDDKTLPAKYVFARGEGDIQQAAGDIANEYNSQTPERRAELLDVHIGGQWSAKVFSGRVVFQCDPRSDATRELSLSGDSASGLIYPQGYDRGSRQGHLVTQTGKVYELGCDQNKAPFLRPASLTFDRPFKRIHKAGNDLIGLGTDGQLYQINGSSSSPLSTPFDGQVHELAPNQFVDFLDK